MFLHTSQRMRKSFNISNRIKVVNTFKMDL